MSELSPFFEECRRDGDWSLFAFSTSPFSFPRAPSSPQIVDAECAEVDELSATLNKLAEHHARESAVLREWQYGRYCARKMYIDNNSRVAMHNAAVAYASAKQPHTVEAFWVAHRKIEETRALSARCAALREIAKDNFYVAARRIDVVSANLESIREKYIAALTRYNQLTAQRLKIPDCILASRAANDRQCHYYRDAKGSATTTSHVVFEDGPLPLPAEHAAL